MHPRAPNRLPTSAALARRPTTVSNRSMPAGNGTLRTSDRACRWSSPVTRHLEANRSAPARVAAQVEYSPTCRSTFEMRKTGYLQVFCPALRLHLFEQQSAFASTARSGADTRHSRHRRHHRRNRCRCRPRMAHRGSGCGEGLRNPLHSCTGSPLRRKCRPRRTTRRRNPARTRDHLPNSCRSSRRSRLAWDLDP